MKPVLAATGKALKKYWYLILLIVLVDIGFLYGFGKTYAIIFQELTIHLNAINDLLQQSVGTFTQTSDPSALNIGIDAFNEELNVVYRGILKILGNLFAFWFVSQGIIWTILHRMIGTKIRWPFVGRFAATTVVGFLLFVGILAGGVYLSFKTFSAQIPLIGQNGINILVAIASFIFLYLLFAAYAVCDQQKFFRKWGSALKKRRVMLSFVFLIAIIAILYEALLRIGAGSVPWAFAFGIFIILPVLAVLRLLFLETIKE